MCAATALSPPETRGPYRLCRPASSEDWETYHRIHRDVSLEAQKYAIELADELAPDHHPHLLWLDAQPIGTIRIDIVPPDCAAMRLVAIEPSCQGRGHGRTLLRLAEDFARGLGCGKAVVYATPDAAGFYSKAGYSEEDWDDVYISGIVQMAKPLC
jgi:N-acetylglutamate synthase-like GNAT family acetyltransferase